MVWWRFHESKTTELSWNYKLHLAENEAKKLRGGKKRERREQNQKTTTSSAGGSEGSTPATLRRKPLWPDLVLWTMTNSSWLFGIRTDSLPPAAETRELIGSFSSRGLDLEKKKKRRTWVKTQEKVPKGQPSVRSLTLTDVSELSLSSLLSVSTCRRNR